MDAARFSQIEDAFHRASELTGAARDRALAEICGGDGELRREVEELLAAAARDTAFDPAAAFRCAPRIPRQIGPYRVLRRLGSGGSSVVYLAEEEGEGFRRQVALKLLTGFPGESLLRRFAVETRILAGLEHPGIARFHTAGRAEDGTAYLVLEYVEGTDLLADCRERRASLAERLRLFAAVLDAVDYAHRNLVVHRDLKPGNILVSLDGQPKLLDFGIAALLDPADGISQGETATLFRAFTPAYASPEQLRGDRVTTASDVYSLGVVLYELLAGVRPYAASSLQDELARGFRAVEPEPPSTAAPASEARQLAGDLDAITLKALRSDPAARYASAAALAEDLRRHGAGLPVLARRSTLRYRTGRFLRRHAAAAAAAAGFVILAGAGLAWHVRGLQRERDRAQAAAEEARREARKAERMVELLSGVFEAANPLDQPGRPLGSRELLERGGARIERSLAEDPELRAELQAVLGGIWTSIGGYDQAAALLEPAAAELERRLGPDHPATAQAWSDLARLRQDKGRYREARALYEKALRVQRRKLGTRHPAVALTLARHGGNLAILGELAPARAALEEAIAIERAVHGPESAQMGRFLNDLSVVHQNLEDWKGAARLIERSAAIIAREYGRESPRYALTLGNLARVRQELGQNEEAITLLQEAIRIDQKVLGEGFPGEVADRNTLAWAYFELHRLAEARREFELAITAAIRNKGPHHTDAAWPMRGLAMVELDLGRTDAARRLVEQSLALRERVHGPVHWEIALSFGDLAEVAAAEGDRKAEESYRRRSLAIYRQVYDPLHPDVALAMAQLGEVVCRRSSGHQEGATLLSEAIALRQKAGSADEPDLAGWRRALDACR